jgi:toxin-antitoxin system PIN domain toxin
LTASSEKNANANRESEIAMILADVNLLLYAYDKDARQHPAAKLWWESVMSGTEPVGIAWVVALAFLRLSTSARAFRRPLSIEQAIGVVDAWFASSVTELVQPTPRHWPTLREQLTVGQATSNLTTDAHLATLAIEHGATLYTTDRDFTRFPGLKFANPIDSRSDA